MPNPLNVPITPPRVAFIDPRTGAVSREWYMFFLSLFQSVEGSSVSLEDLQKGPPEHDDGLIVIAPLALGDVAPPVENNAAQPVLGAPSIDSLADQIAELRKQVEGLATQTRQELGTMAALQQNNVPWIQFDNTPTGWPTGSAAAGTLYWDEADGNKTLNLVMEDSGGVVQQIGEENYFRIKASAAITNGQVVMFTGTVGASGALQGAPATGLTPFQNEYVMGVATQDIANNGWGYVTQFGLVRQINTTGGAEAWVDGQILYYNPAVTGGLTKTVPLAPNPKVIVAVVILAAVNGSLFVRPTYGSALGATDSNVEIISLANGDLLQYDSVQARWENVPASTVIAGTATAPVTKTANFTVATGEKWIINNKSGSTCTVTLPSAATNTGRELYFQNYQAQLLVSASSNVAPLGGGVSGTAILAAVGGDHATLVSDGSRWIMMEYGPNNVLLLE